MMKKDRFYLQVTMVAATLLGCYAILSEPQNLDMTEIADNSAMEPASSSSRGPASVSPSAKKIKVDLPEIKYSASENSLLKSADINAWERKMKIAILSRRHAAIIPGGEDVGGRTIEEMKKHPKESFAAFKSLLAKLPADEFPFDRASLIDVMGDFPELREQAKEVAMQELASSVVQPRDIPQDLSPLEMDKALSSNDYEFLPMISHSVLVRNANSPQEAIQLTIKALNYQPDLGVRGTIVNQFINYYPTYASALNTEIKNRRIVMPAPSAEFSN